MAKKSAKAKGPRQRLAKLPPRQPGAWQRAQPFYPKNAPPDIVDEFKLKPSATSLKARKACVRKIGGKSGKVAKVLRDCHVELIFDDGAFLRFCTTAGEPGPMVPVTTHTEATRLSRQFCACRVRGTDATTCATEVAPGAPLRGQRRKGR
jgi:hypothetical protein